jgi:hypothetical protein
MTQARSTKTKPVFLVALMAAGIAAFLSAAPVMAANPAQLTLRVRCTDATPPTAVADFSAARDNSTEGRVILMWTAPADQPGNVPVTAYDIRYATYSVMGSTTNWWNGAVSLPLTETLPVGGDESFIIDDLLGGTTYFFALRSRDAAGNWSALDDAVLGGAQVRAVPYGVRPAPVAGLSAFTNPDTSFNVMWAPVTMNADGSAFTDLSDYVVYRSNNLTGPFSTTVSSGAATSGFEFSATAAPTAVEYLRIVARDTSGNESDPATSNLLEVTPQGIIGQIALAADGTVSRAYVPASLMGELDNNGNGLLLRVAANTDSALNRDPRVVATYDVGVVSSTQAVDKNFTFSRPAMNVVIQSTTPVTEGSVGVLWWNGTAWVKLGQADVDELTNTVSFRTALPGTYQVRSFQAATALTLDKGNVFPRIFSPNGDGVNDTVFFVIDNPNGSAVEGKIYDVAGNEVSDIRPAGAGAPTANSLSWNGRDRNGTLVNAGVYIYLIKGEGKKMTGTVVVAK